MGSINSFRNYDDVAVSMIDYNDNTWPGHNSRIDFPDLENVIIPPNFTVDLLQLRRR